LEYALAYMKVKLWRTFMRLLIRFWFVIAMLVTPLLVQANETSDQGSDKGKTTVVTEGAPVEEEEPEPDCE
jgi:hypothetical protein